MASTANRPIRIILGASFGISLALCYMLLWRETPLWAAAFGAFAGALALAFAWTRRLSAKSPLIGLFLLVAFGNLCVVVPELALRAADFRFESGIQFGYPRPSDFVAFVPDEELFWRLRYPQPAVNSRGFPGDEFETEKPDGVFRIVFLGDSVTQQGYPDYAEVLLNAGLSRGDRRVESIMLAVSGYSSHQGRVLAERHALPLDPDAAVIYFGWNDHWQAYGAVDAEKRVSVETGAVGQTYERLQRSIRILQATRWIASALRGGGDSGPLDVARVPLETYRENLARIRAVFVERGIPVVFITAPTTIYRFGVPDYLLDLGFLPDKETGLRRHAAYNAEVRRLAGPGVHVLDLEREFEKGSDADLRAIFSPDAIHLTPAGSAAVADHVVEVLAPYVSR